MTHAPREPGTADEAASLARQLALSGRTGDAQAVLRWAAARWPDRGDLSNELGVLLAGGGRYAEAEACFQRAIEGGDARGWQNLAVAKERRGAVEEGADVLDQAAAALPDDPGIQIMRARLLGRLNRVGEATAAVRRAIDLRPSDPEARWVHAWLLLLAGNMEEGWREHESRLRCPWYRGERRACSPLRDALADLRGRSVVVYGEQGAGDTIQFARYATLLADRGAAVTAVVPPNVAKVVPWVPGVSRVTTTIGSSAAADFHVPLMSLPLVFGTTLDTVPAAVPYVAPPADLVDKWAGRVRGVPGLKVGIAWSGSQEQEHNQDRSLPLADFAPLAAVDGVTLFSLQKGPPAAQANPPPPGVRLTNLTAGIADFADTAGLIANLDLVVTVDTSVAHLAGAMGKPTWTLLQFAPDWRWMLGRDDSPWYPTMRLFRQQSRRDWAPVVARVTAELRALAQK